MIIKKDSSDDLLQTDVAIVTWDEKYATGVVLIDNQHKELIELINQLHNACLAGGETVGTTFKEAMSRMVEYVRFHFGTEQELLQRIKFPDIHNHKKQHAALIKSILEAAKDYSNGKKYVPNTFVRTLKDWVLGHIAVYDKAYALYVADQRRKGILGDKQ